MKEFLRPPFVPPVWLLAAVILMLCVDQIAGQQIRVPDPYSDAGWLFIAGGLSVALYVDLIFKRKGTTILPFRDSSALITEGPFRYSRNPIYCGMAAALTGLALLLGKLLPFLVVPAFVWLISRYFIRREEEMLEAAFGAEYRAYKARVRRWI